MWWTILKVLVGLTVYGTAVEPRFVARNDERAVIPNLPPSWEGKQVAVFADMQVGMWWANTDAIRRAVRQVQTIRPAFVLLAGDFVYKANWTIRRRKSSRYCVPFSMTAFRSTPCSGITTTR